MVADRPARDQTGGAGVEIDIRNANLARGDRGDRNDAARPILKRVGKLRRHRDAMPPDDANFAQDFVNSGFKGRQPRMRRAGA